MLVRLGLAGNAEPVVFPGPFSGSRCRGRGKRRAAAACLLTLKSRPMIERPPEGPAAAKAATRANFAYVLTTATEPERPIAWAG